MGVMMLNGVQYSGTIENGGGGIAPDNMIKFKAHAGNGEVKLYIKGPDDTVIDGQNICTVKGVKITRKTDGYPETETDGTIVLDLTLDDFSTYEETPYIDEGLTNNTTYYYAAFPYSDYEVYNRNTKNRSSATPKQYTIYGYMRNKNDSNPATCITYTDDAETFTAAKMNFDTGEFEYGSWADTFILNSFRPVALKYNGTVDYELDHDDQTKKLDGTASDISDSNYQGNFMVGVKPIWIYRYEDDYYEVVKFSDKKIDENYKCYANMNEAEEVLDEVFLPMFEGSNVSSKVRSIAGQAPMASTAGATEIAYAEANGSGWYLDDWSNHRLIEDLLYLLGKSTDAQSIFGTGYYTGGSSSTGLKQTGLLKSKGMFYGDNNNGPVKVFWLENYYGDRWDRTAGCVYGTDGKLKVKMHPPYNTDGTGYIDTGVTLGGSSGGYISESKMTEYGRLPVTMSGSESTYIPDGVYFNTSQLNYALSGGACTYGLHVGPSALIVSYALSNSLWGCGPSVSYKAPAAA